MIANLILALQKLDTEALRTADYRELAEQHGTTAEHAK